MSTIVYPKCPHDNIRRKVTDFTSPLARKDIRVTSEQKKADEELIARGEFVCPTCRDGKVVIAKGNRFDKIKAKE